MKQTEKDIHYLCIYAVSCIYVQLEKNTISNIGMPQLVTSCRFCGFNSCDLAKQTSTSATPMCLSILASFTRLQKITFLKRLISSH